MEKIKYCTRLLLLSILVSLLTGCQKTFSPSLREIDKILFVDYERGEKLLDSVLFANPNMSKPDLMYCQLLKLKADDKAYRPIVYQKEHIDSLVSFFQASGDPDLLSEAYFYAGRVYYEKGDAPAALKFYQKASEKVSTNNYSLQGDIYCQMSYIYYFSDLYQDALKTLKLASKADSLSGNTRNMLYDLRDIGQAYGGENDLDKATFYFLKGLKAAKTLGDSFMQKSFHHQLATIYAKKKDWRKALIHVEKYIHGIDEFEDKSGMLVTALDVYSQLDMVENRDSCKRLILKDGNIFAKQRAVEDAIFSSIKEPMVKTDSALLKLYKRYTDSVELENKTIAVKKAEQTYNYELKEAENTKLRLNNMLVNIGLVVTIIIVCLLIAYSYLKVKIMKQRQVILELKLDKYKALQEKMKIKSKERMTTELSVIRNSDIYNYLQSSIEKNQYNLTEEHWKALSSLVNSVYEGYDQNLQAFLDVSPQERKICLLIKIGISPTNIAHFMFLTKEAISASRRRMYQKAFKKKDTPSDWDKILQSL